MKWDEAYPKPRKGCLFAIPVLLLTLPMTVLGPLANQATQWGNDPTPEERAATAAYRAEQRRRARVRRGALSKRIRGIRRRKGGDS